MPGSLFEALRLVFALALVSLPGTALARRFAPWRADPVVHVTYAALLGLGTYAVAFWWLRWLPLSLTGLVVTCSVAATASLALRARHITTERATTDNRKGMLLVVALLAVQLVLRLVPLPLCPVAPGVDMSMHTAMARLIVEADGVPATLRPLYPVDHFGTLPAGFPAAAAVLSSLSGVPVWRTSLLLACLTYLLLTLALYTLARRHAGPPAAAVAALVVSAGAKDPQLHFLWGGNPSVLALVLFAAALPLLDDLTTDRWRSVVVPTTLLLSAAALTHPIVPAAGAYAVAAVLLVRALRRGRRWLAAAAGRASIVLGLVAVTALPCLLHLRNPLSAAELAVTREWHRTALQIPSWASGSWLLAGPAWIVDRLGPLVIVAVALALLLRGRPSPRHGLGEEGLFALVVLALAANSLVHVLPFSPLLYPDRVITLLVVPGTLVVAKSLATLDPVADARRSPRILAATGGLALALGAGLPLAYWFWYLQGVRYMAVTRSDLAAIAWIGANTPPDTVIANNYGDAGVWIPALALRSVTSPHAHFLYEDETRAWAACQSPPLVFVGAKAVASGIRFTSAALASQPWRYRRAFRLGRSEVYSDEQARGGQSP